MLIVLINKGLQEYTKPSVETISSGSSSFVWRKQDPADSGLLEQYTKVIHVLCCLVFYIIDALILFR